MNSFIISLIRTYVPVAVGVALTWLASTLHIVIYPSSQAGLVALCVAVLTSAYYLLARFLESKIPALGVPAKPHYKPASHDLDGNAPVADGGLDFGADA